MGLYRKRSCRNGLPGSLSGDSGFFNGALGIGNDLVSERNMVSQMSNVEKESLSGPVTRNGMREDSDIDTFVFVKKAQGTSSFRVHS
jgi:hypothetical protein